MKLEISIEACNHVKNDLLQRLAHLVPRHPIEETADKSNCDRFTLNFISETPSPDTLLQEIAAAVSAIEDHYPGAQRIELHVRNIACSEPSWRTLQNGGAFSPVDSIRIVPWDSEESPAPGTSDIFLHPAHAFGTGLHPSTRLCLQLLKLAAHMDSERSCGPRAALDIGCGSGILTIAAIRLGAARVLAIEIDPSAVQAASRNIQINGLAHAALVVKTSWHEISGQYDLVLANLVPSVLYKAAPHIAKLLRKQGLLITAGFPLSKNAEVRGLFAKNGLRLLHECSLDGWGALLITG